MWAVLAGVLLTGDIEFAGDDSAYVVSGDDVMAKACNQLGIVQDALTEALTCSINIMRGMLRLSAIVSACQRLSALGSSCQLLLVWHLWFALSSFVGLLVGLFPASDSAC